MEHAGERLDQIMIPKVGCAADIYAVDALVSAIEAAKGRSKRVSFEVIIESAAGIAHVEEIAASKRSFASDEPRGRGFCGLYGHADNGDRWHPRKLLHGAQWRSALVRPRGIGPKLRL